jgi:hypothetical protein
MYTNKIRFNLLNFDSELVFYKADSKLASLRNIDVYYKNTLIGEFYIDERFNTIRGESNKRSSRIDFNKIYHYLMNKYNELKKTDFRYGDWERNGISPTLYIFVEDFLDYLKEDIRDFKINILLNEEK